MNRRGFNSLHSLLLYPYSCRPLEKGRGKAAGWMRHCRWTSILFTQFSILLLPPLLRRFCPCGADPSPALRAAPFSKGARAYGYSQYVRYSFSMQPLREGARQSRRMDAALPLGLNSFHSILNSTFTLLCSADSASSRQIHPLPFGLPPSPRGHVLTVILNM